MNNYEQRSDEKLAYRQSVINGTIDSAEWTITPEGPTVEMIAEEAKYTTALVSELEKGLEYVLLVSVTLTDGQIIRREANISCYE
jgi:hypothetical protein